MDWTVVNFVFLLLGVITFLMSTFQVAVTKINLVPLGLLFWILVPFFETLRQL